MSKNLEWVFQIDPEMVAELEGEALAEYREALEGQLERTTQEVLAGFDRVAERKEVDRQFRAVVRNITPAAEGLWNLELTLDDESPIRQGVLTHGYVIEFTIPEALMKR